MTNVFEIEATNTGGDFEAPPTGTHVAVCVALIDLGTHQGEYKGQPREDRKLLIVWELPSEIKSDGDPFVMWAEYNVMDELSRKSNLRKMLEGWRGSPYNDRDKIDLKLLLGRPCLLNLIEKSSADGSKRYVKIENVVPVPKGTPRPKPFHDPYLWSDLSNPFEGPDWLPYVYGKTIADYIAESMEASGIPVSGRAAQGATNNGRNHDGDNSDCPF